MSTIVTSTGGLTAEPEVLHGSGQLFAGHGAPMGGRIEAELGEWVDDALNGHGVTTCAAVNDSAGRVLLNTRLRNRAWRSRASGEHGAIVVSTIATEN